MNRQRIAGKTGLSSHHRSSVAWQVLWVVAFALTPLLVPSALAQTAVDAPPQTVLKPAIRPASEVRGDTYVALASGLERVFSEGREPMTLAELKTLELQQSRVAELIEKVTVNVQQGSAQGSGVLITPDGYVLTAAHVAGKPNLDATIVFSDGRRVRAKTLGMNRNADAGLLKIVDGQSQAWPYASLGRVNNSLREGQWCVAAGYPGGWKAHRGVVIRVGRILDIDRYRSTGAAHTLFTDCALIGGDSGGPLFTLEGKLIGVHSRIGTEIVDNMHVPIDVFDDNWDRMVKGEVWGMLPGYKPLIGVVGAQGDDRPVIAAVSPGGPAARAGIMAGDLILTFNGAKITTFAELQMGVEGTMPGEVIVLTLRRDQQDIRVSVTVGTEG